MVIPVKQSRYNMSYLLLNPKLAGEFEDGVYLIYSQSTAWPLTLLVSDAGAFRRQSVDTGALRARQAAFELVHQQPDVVHGGLRLGVQV